MSPTSTVDVQRRKSNVADLISRITPKPKQDGFRKSPLSQIPSRLPRRPTSRMSIAEPKTPRLGQGSPSSVVRQNLASPTTPRRISSQSYTQLLAADAQDRIHTLEAQLAQARKKADKLYTASTEDSRRIKKLYAALDACTAQRDNFEQQVAGYKIVVASIEEKLRASEKRHRFHAGKIELLRTNLVGAYLQIEEERLENAQLRSTIAQLSRKPKRRPSDAGSDETLTLWQTDVNK